MDDAENSHISNNEILANDGAYKRLNSIDKLHNLTAQIAPPITPLKNISNHDGQVEHEEIEVDDSCSLEDVRPLRDIDFETDINSEDSWLFESPVKAQTPGKKQSIDVWLKQNVSTPELLRVRGSLSAALEVIAIESRKGQYQKLRKDSQDNRRISKAGRSGSCLSLDWDYDESEELAMREPMEFDSPNQYDSPDDLADGSSHYGMPRSIAEQLNHMHKDRQAWSEPARKHKLVRDEENPFSLDWSESDDEDLKPMKIDFDSPPNATYRKQANPTIVKRGGSGIGVPVVGHAETNNNEFIARPRGNVRPRGSSNNLIDRDSPSTDDAGLRLSSRENSFDALGPPKPRGAKKETPRSTNIAKPVQRRKPGNDTESPRLRSSASTGQIRPRGLQPPEVRKANSSLDVNNQVENSLKVKLPSGDGPVRRRGAAPAETAPTPRRSKEPVARTQAIPQVRRSTGQIPPKSDVPRPRRSHSPASSNLVRPRGAPLAQSYQADY